MHSQEERVLITQNNTHTRLVKQWKEEKKIGAKKKESKMNAKAKRF